MRIDIQARHIKVTRSLLRVVRRHLAFAFNRFQDRIQSVQVRLSDINGPKGGVDKECRIQVTIPKGREIIVKGQSKRLDLAISTTATRSARALAKQLGKKRAKRHNKVAPIVEF